MKALATPRRYETLLFLALLSGPPRLRERDPSASLSLDVDWAVLLNAAVLGLGMLWVLLKFNERLLLDKTIPRFDMPQKLALSLVLCLFLSTAFSPAPLFSAYKTLQILTLILFGFFWVSKFGIDSTIKHLSVGHLLLAVAIAVCAVAAPDLVYRAGRLRGELIADTGTVAVTGIMLSLCYPVMKSRLGLLVALLLCSVLLILSQTRTAFLILFLFLAVGMVRQPRIPALRYFRFALGILLLGALVVGTMPAVTDWVVRDPESISDLSDRVPLWRHLLSQLLSTSPWFGFGVYGYRSLAREYNTNLGNAHNAFVEILCGGGIVGFTVFLLLFFLLSSWAWRLICAHGRTPLVFLVVTLFWGAICTGLTGAEMITEAPTNFLFWTLVSLIPRVRQAVQTEPHSPAATHQPSASPFFPLAVQER
jgi:hypothetical protein